MEESGDSRLDRAAQVRSRRHDRASNHRSLPPQGDPASAKPLYERAIAIGEKTLGPEHPELAKWLNNFAGLLRAQVRSRCAIEPRITALFRPQGDLASAKPLYERAIAIGEKTLGPEHPDLAISLNNLAGLLRAQVRSRRRDRASNHRSLPPAGGSRERKAALQTRDRYHRESPWSRAPGSRGLAQQLRSAAARRERTWARSSPARLFSEIAKSGCSGPSVFSPIAIARS